MSTKWTSLICIIVIVGLVGYSVGQEKEKITCTGKVVDSDGRPISGTKVSLYNLIVFIDTMSFDAELAETTNTNSDGVFNLEAATASSQTDNQAIILAEKEGMALGWLNWNLHQNIEVTITLGAPQVLAGKVVDESGKPVVDAEVGISVMLIAAGNEPRYTAGKISERLFTRKTDASGSFRFEQIPSDAAAELIVKKAGMGTVSTLDEKAMEGMQLQFKAGRTDIEIKLPTEAKIEGTVVEKQTGKPASGVKLMVYQGQKQPFTGIEPVTSGQDGTFTIDALREGRYIVQAIPGKKETEDWVTGTVEVDTEAGQTSSGVKLELTKGGLVEIAVTEEDANTPVEGATVSMQNTASREQSSGVTDANGIVSKRLAPGEYRIIQVYKQDFPYERQEKSFIVEDNKTCRVTIRLKGYPKVTGVLRDENGQPVAGAQVKVCPHGRGEMTTKSDGRYEVRREIAEWAAEAVPYVVARQFERNLAAAVEIEKDTKIIDIKMTPGVVCTGRIVDVNDKPIENTKVYLTFWSTNYGTSMAQQDNKTDSQGRYEIKAVPHHPKYSVTADAEGYGQDYVRISTEDAENNRYEVKDIALALANLSIAGVVVDIDDKPIENARVFCQGRGQPNKNIQTDKDGKFKIDEVCAGTIRISASKSTGNTYISGDTSAEGGQTNIRLVLYDRSSGSVRREPPSLSGKSLPDLSIFEIGPPLTDIENKAILICFWDMQQRPSRNCIMQLSKSLQELKAKDIEIIAVQASKIEQEKLNEWIKENKISFPLGMIATGEEKVRFNWGVKSLPWLILTDSKHTVTAEGFSVSKLDEIIAK
ncbi:MAG: carboxypeptidase regulatory-like domain-containing protein [Sedimentisphaerales bacterium]|nr:carboxypeptidase regulatory-like domain-containing protein [Sedimentisphaerales bacterium]